jgi:hypothetical protein
MSDFDKKTCATAIAATVADLSQKANQEEGQPESAFSEELVELTGPLAKCWQSLLHPLLHRMDEHVDCRLLKTLERTILSVLQHRNRATGLLLSELGAFICGPDHAPAGTKRLSNLLRSKKWKAREVDDYLWSQAIRYWEDLVFRGEEALMVWDDSVLEKPESLQSEGLCPVRSSKAKRLSRIKPGYYRPPGAPVFVPGFHWSTLLLIGRTGPPLMASMRWWSTRWSDSDSSTSSAPEAARPEWLLKQREAAHEMLDRCIKTFELGVLHIFDRGYAGEPWLTALDQHGARFVLRWSKQYALTSETGTRKPAWKLLRGQRFVTKFKVKDGSHKREQEVGLKIIRVFHSGYGYGLCPLWLVVSSPGKGREPWYLLTNESIVTVKDAQSIVLAYARRWQIESCFRFNKTELAMESPRLWTWERRLKLLMIVTLVYALLLALLQLPQQWRKGFLQRWCHRTGKRSQDALTPLSRIRTAIAALLLSSHLELRFYQSSG